MAVVALDEAKKIDVYAVQATARGVLLADACNDDAVWSACRGRRDASIRSGEEELPLDVATVRHGGDGLDTIRQSMLGCSFRPFFAKSNLEWALDRQGTLRLYEQRFVQEAEPGVPQTRSTSQRLRKQMRKSGCQQPKTGVKPEAIWVEIASADALPSILESLALLHSAGKDVDCASPDGLPHVSSSNCAMCSSARSTACIPDCRIPHEHIYGGEASSPEHMSDERAWSLSSPMRTGASGSTFGAVSTAASTRTLPRPPRPAELQAFDTCRNKPRRRAAVGRLRY